MSFDIEGARKAGYSEGEIADYLGSQNNFDVMGARKSGYADGEIISHLSAPSTPAQPETSWYQNAAIGVGKGMTDIGTGALQRVLEGGEAIRSAVGMESNQPNIDRLKAITEENRRAFEPLKEQSTAANVGEFIGQAAPTAIIPGGVVGGVIKRAGTSALSGAATGALQPTAGNESVVENAVTGGVFGAGASGVLSGGGKIINALLNRLPPNFTEALAKRYGIRTTLGEATGNPIIQKAESWLEGVPIIGLGKLRKNQLEDAERSARGTVARYIVDPESPDAMKANRAFASSLYKRMTDEVSGIQDQNILPHETRQAASDILERYPDLFKKFQDTKRERIIGSIIEDTAPSKDPYAALSSLYGMPATGGQPATITFKDAWFLRDSLGEMIGQAKKALYSGAVDRTQYAELSKLYGAVNRDIDTWANAIGRPDVRIMINDANAAYKQYVVKYDLIQRAYDKATSLTGESEKFSPKKFSMALTKIIYSDKIYGTFTPNEIDELAGIANIMNVVKRAGQFSENPPTGSRWGLPVAATVAGTSGAAAVAPYLVISRFLTTEGGKRLALAASKIEPDSQSMKVIMKMVYNQIPKMAATGATRD
jgi:hypothetical protein